MKATQELEQQHRTIERAASACGVFAEMLQEDRKVPAEVLRKLVAFLRIYGEQYHEEQEEWLFGMLMNKGVPRGSCPIATLTHEGHKRAMLVNQLASAVDVYEQSANAVTGTLISTLQALAELYRDHIWKEDFLLLPMAEKIFAESDQRILAENIRRVELASGAAARQTVQDFSIAMRMCPECNPPERRAA